ncbi:MAG TPA: oxidoreductase [Acidiphilium sp.]|nr:MAG: short-chain dehydrogenase/reductase [Acidiphilium sp. 21-60-14]OYV91398.1 MAG: short-chain dehydrogenase/reductase [Acidiphilium sp. 37-60-79]OZB41392.1 MAG: short-chain dehydrogenase/reductase [Acidiphilium sp. 34-60-192]HQT87270.1 oxidoreductase [Acidiphilium sp.]HQU23197.1 oxidoreductase [Acidiphilium sp.]
MPSTTRPSDAADKPVWFITGCSTGFGRALAEHVLKLGYRVVVTARQTAEINMLKQYGAALILPLDVTDERAMIAAVAAAEQTFGRIDVLVNNAGIGYFAAVEESEEKAVRQMFDINVFGLGAMIKAVLPGMRARRSGFIVNISSIAGIRSFPAMGYYCASKAAVEGLSGSLAQEVEPLGIRVMVVEPSGFRTDWAGRSAEESGLQIADYAKTAGAARHHLRTDSGEQPGDPSLAAQAIVEAVESGKAPHHLLLGSDAYDQAVAQLAMLGKDFAAWQTVARSADGPKRAA